jgi:hypothetical protein
MERGDHSDSLKLVQAKAKPWSSRDGTHSYSIREAAPEEIRPWPADAVLDRVRQDAGYEHGEQKACLATSFYGQNLTTREFTAGDEQKWSCQLTQNGMVQVIHVPSLEVYDREDDDGPDDGVYLGKLERGILNPNRGFLLQRRPNGRVY